MTVVVFRKYRRGRGIGGGGVSALLGKQQLLLGGVFFLFASQLAISISTSVSSVFFLSGSCKRRSRRKTKTVTKTKKVQVVLQVYERKAPYHSVT